MANVKITELTELAAVDLAENDVLPIVDVGSDATKKVTIVSLREFSSANDFLTWNYLNANLDIVSANVVAAEANTVGVSIAINANLDIVQDNVASLTSSFDSNSAALALGIANIDVDTPVNNLETRVNANLDIVQDNVAVNVTNINTVQDNVVVNISSINLVQDNVASLTSSTSSNAAELALGIENVDVDTPVNNLETRVNANLDIVQDNVAVNVTNINTVQDNVAVNVTNINTVQDNVNIVQDNVAVNVTNINTVQDNVNIVQDNVAVNVTNINTVQDNVAASEANVAVNAGDITAVELRRDNNTFYTYNTHSVVSTANIVPSTNNTISLGSPNEVFKDVYVGPGTVHIGNVRLEDQGGALAIIGSDDSTATIDTQTANVTAALNDVQGNVAASEANIIAYATQANTNLDTKANVSATYFLALANDFVTYTQLNSNINIVQDNVAVNVTNINTVQDNVSASEANIIAYATQANTNLDTKANVSATYFLALANDFATYTHINANLDIVQDNVASVVSSVANITDGTTPFSGPVTMNDTLTVSGNLYVAGAQVDLGIGAAQIDDATILLAANTPGDAALASDSGFLINRGQDANVFFGFAQYGDHIDVIFTDAPGDNVVHYPIAYVDFHANSFGAEGNHSPAFTALHHADRPTTGIYFPTNQIVHTVGGAYKANVTTSGLEATAVFSNGVELRANDWATYSTLSTEDTAIEARRVANIAGAVSTITTGNLTTSRAVVSDGSGKVAVSAVTSTEIGYLDGVTSAIQTQIDSKQASLAGATLDLGTL